MNKKQRNRKVVTQNNRNRMINRRYTSTVKTLFKLFIKKINENNEENKTNSISEIKQISSHLSSIIDKAVKKGVFHKNTAARKKSKMTKLFRKIVQP